jgi:seryl-tRNA synthetase
MTSPRLSEPVLPAGGPGISVFGAGFEELVDRLQAGIGRLGAVDHPVRLGVPPVVPRATLERTGYAAGFPHLLGTVHASDAETELAMLPAACYHVYPQVAGADLAEALVVDVTGHCFRNECGAEPGRLRSFRMRELVRMDRAASALGWRDAWVERALEWLRGLDLNPRQVLASDPFFGPAARLMGRLQEEEQLKWELVVEVAAGTTQAVVSCNYHKDHFGALFDVLVAGEAAHTACTAFGLERLALAVLHRHGTDAGSWPV